MRALRRAADSTNGPDGYPGRRRPHDAVWTTAGTLSSFGAADFPPASLMTVPRSRNPPPAMNTISYPPRAPGPTRAPRDPFPPTNLRCPRRPQEYTSLRSTENSVGPDSCIFMGLGLLLGQRKTPPPPQSTRTHYRSTDAGRTLGALPAFLAWRWPVLERPPFAFHGRLQRLMLLLLPLHASSTSVASRRQEPSDVLGQ
ncbi:hypothetical protein HPB47_012882 [Ixodes persulcatus]|uniref:Uncharacterized protein n=1 Tax=Ixodes persulcatus TaxID=34615 RepID=A0AC60NS99_IXOPE|nr:hypothetical protein HPB47_012882 [Ixodes persulcatus]